MKFEILKFLSNPYTLIFLVLMIGSRIENIKIGKFKLGISGNLFTGLFFGWAVLNLLEGVGPDSEYYAGVQKILHHGLVPHNVAHFFLYLFIAAVGLASAKDLGKVLKKYGAKFVLLSVILTATGGLSVYLLRDNIGDGLYEMSGVYTAALTSSPGVAAALETTEDSSYAVVDNFPNLPDATKDKILKVIDPSHQLTHFNTTDLTKAQKDAFVHEAVASTGAANAIGFPFGVIMVILAMSFLPKLFRVDLEKEQAAFKIELESMKADEANQKPIGKFNMIAFACCIFSGLLLGSVQVYLGPIGYFSLGSTGGILVASLILGHIGEIAGQNFRMEPATLNVLKKLGLGAFVGIIGLTYGNKVIAALFSSTGLYIAMLSVAVAFICMVVGFVVGKYVFKINWVMLSGAICGGMTSTPGLGAAIEAVESEEAGAGYAATYPFALVCMVLFTIVMNHLPI
ncbi:hypothetical protein [Vibrio quintilis]|uniref:Putative transporter n=1 Tax=Vibrio quintilis TaxID=1117707 RepID=A0A1M7YQI4_9VIBR|nr:hypothetical protein [Vibrio quintilis]SHO54913.1 putative transporter [Vibrio quintilis]